MDAGYGRIPVAKQEAINALDSEEQKIEAAAQDALAW